MVHSRRKRTGHFWQGRFGAVAMDEPHLAAAFRYVTLNPVRARLVRGAEDWQWSSARADLGLGDDAVTDLAPARQRFSRFADLLEGEEAQPRHRGCAREKAWAAPSVRKAFSQRWKPKRTAAYARSGADRSRPMTGRAG